MSAHAGARARPEVRRLLDAARIAVDMDASLVTLHEGDEEVFVATSSRSALLRGAAGRRTPLADTICGQVVAGRLPRWIPDAGADPLASVLPVTRAHGIGSYVGTPLHDDDGHVAGMLCCLSRAPDDRIGPGTPAVLESLASALSVELGLAHRVAEPPAAVAPRPPALSSVDHHRAVLSLARGDDVDVLFEPVVDLATDRPRAFAAAFRAPACHGADVGAVVGAHGLAEEVELACLRRALDHQGRQPRGTALAVAVSRALLRRPGVVDLLLDHVRSGLWVAVGHGPDADWAAHEGAAHEGARRLRAAGAVLAVDGAGTPSAGLVDALRLGPPLVSVSAPALDGARGGEDVRPELVRALLAVTRSVGARLVVRDVATTRQLDALRALGVPLARGSALGGPAPLPPG